MLTITTNKSRINALTSCLIVGVPYNAAINFKIQNMIARR
jgi:hypothetical protein